MSNGIVLPRHRAILDKAKIDAMNCEALAKDRRILELEAALELVVSALDEGMFHTAKSIAISKAKPSQGDGNE